MHHNHLHSSLIAIVGVSAIQAHDDIWTDGANFYNFSMNKIVAHKYCENTLGLQRRTTHGIVGCRMWQSCASGAYLTYTPFLIIYQIEKLLHSQNERILNKCCIGSR